MRRHIPNAVTALRLLCAAAMLFANADFGLFWLLYALCGISDVLDGALARGLHAESRLGSRLDSIADLAFTAVCAVQLLPRLHLPAGLWICIAVIAACKSLRSSPRGIGIVLRSSTTAPRTGWSGFCCSVRCPSTGCKTELYWHSCSARSHFSHRYSSL